MTTMSNRTSLIAFLSCLSPWVAACSSGGGPGEAAGPTGSIAFEATDAPMDPELIARALLEIDAIRVHYVGGSEKGFVTVYEGEPLVLNLTSLRNGLTKALSRGFLQTGEYNELQIHVTDASLELKNGNQYSTRDGTIQLTSQGTSGYKIFLDPPVEVYEGVETRVLLDFQLPKTFSPVPDNNLENARLFHLHPNVRVAVLQETGELRGVVTTMDAKGVRLYAPGAVVYVLDPGETDPDGAVASTMTDADGSAAILGLPAGTYDVLAVHEGRTGRADGLVITAEAITGFEIQVE